MRSQFPSPKAGVKAGRRADRLRRARWRSGRLRRHRGARRHADHDLADPRRPTTSTRRSPRAATRSSRSGSSTRRCSPTATRTASAGAELIPGLASDLPEISADGRTYELELRKDLTYSDGTDGARLGLRARRSSACASSRSPGRPLLPRGSPAIDADDESGQITIELTAPDRELADALALPYAAPVPASDPGSRPERRARRPASAPTRSPRSSPTAGSCSSATATLRGPRHPRRPDRATSSRSRATIDPSRERQAQDVLDGKVDYMHDPPPPALGPTIAEQASDRFAVTPTAATAYFTLDTAARPVRRPARPRGGQHGARPRRRSRAVTAACCSPGCALLAPGVPGYDRELDTTDARTAIRASRRTSSARARADRAGRRRGARVIVGAGDDPRTRAATRAYASRAATRSGCDAAARAVRLVRPDRRW